MSTLSENNSVNQKGAKAGKNIAARDINETYIENANLPPQPKKTKVENLLERLQLEIDGNIEARQMIDDLQYYHERLSVDGIDGLENKLKHYGADESEILKAMMKKEAFNKKLEKFVHYNSAQEIFALLLSKVDYFFDTEISPLIETASSEDIAKQTKEKIVDPVMAEISDDIMGLNYNHVVGMVYWLAEQCFIRWHK